MSVSSDNSGLLFEAEVDDDVFYAEIRDWILQLTTEEDDEKHDDDDDNNVGQFLRETKHVKKPIVSGGGNGGSLYGSVYGYGNGFPVGSTWEAQNCGGPPPVWLMNMWKKNGKGTGVFIPQAVVGCNKNPPRTGRTNSRRKTYKPVATKN
ncbi:hypothetical protein QN277_003931 [Acacia crassicarpa]|uniref:Uncharacterized protein n=1 Tax=Acacia crassicarpa TaxID=499986 RepID=A0AAE1J0P9_9FABA|nr:hypothetical protein QN277_003931 [Acacia crassicarpa]